MYRTAIVPYVSSVHCGVHLMEDYHHQLGTFQFVESAYSQHASILYHYCSTCHLSCVKKSMSIIILDLSTCFVTHQQIGDMALKFSLVAILTSTTKHSGAPLIRTLLGHKRMSSLERYPHSRGQECTQNIC